MRTYESIVILHPELAGDELTESVEKLKGLLEQQQAEILKVDNWGTKKLAYLVKKQPRGTYILLIFKSDADVIKEYERRLRIDETVLKFQTIHLEEGYVEPPVEKAPETTDQEEAVEEAKAEPAEEAKADA
jgi:small subunit ribosomal protein S6